MKREVKIYIGSFYLRWIDTPERVGELIRLLLGFSAASEAIKPDYEI